MNIKTLAIQPAPVRNDVVEMLEALLAEARAGSVVGFVFVGRSPGESKVGSAGDLDARDIALAIIDMQALLVASRLPGSKG